MLAAVVAPPGTVGSMSDRYTHPDREWSGPWFTLGRLEMGTTEVVTGLGLVSFLVLAIAPSLAGVLALNPASVVRGAVWQVATWPLANLPSLWTLLSLAMFWYFGRELEREVGRTRWAAWLGIVTLGSGVLALLAAALVGGGSIGGISTLATLVMVLFIAEHPQLKFWFGIPAWIIGIVLVALPLLQLLAARAWLDLVHLLLGLVVAAVAARSIGLLTSFGFLPGRPSNRRRRPSRQARAEAQSRAKAADARTELDALLDKIHASGIGALTDKERKRLGVLREQLRGG